MQSCNPTFRRRVDTEIVRVVQNYIPEKRDRSATPKGEINDKTQQGSPSKKRATETEKAHDHTQNSSKSGTTSNIKKSVVNSKAKKVSLTRPKAFALGKDSALRKQQKEIRRLAEVKKFEEAERLAEARRIEQVKLDNEHPIRTILNADARKYIYNKIDDGEVTGESKKLREATISMSVSSLKISNGTLRSELRQTGSCQIQTHLTGGKTGNG